MANWRKLLKPGPIDLGTRHLNDVTVPDEYVQPYGARVTKAQGYPIEGVGGLYKLIDWNPVSGSQIATFTTPSAGIFTTYKLNGTWRTWTDAMGRPVP